MAGAIKRVAAGLAQVLSIGNKTGQVGRRTFLGIDRFAKAADIRPAGFSLLRCTGQGIRWFRRLRRAGLPERSRRGADQEQQRDCCFSSGRHSWSEFSSRRGRDQIPSRRQRMLTKVVAEKSSSQRPMYFEVDQSKTNTGTGLYRNHFPTSTTNSASSASQILGTDLRPWASPRRP